MPARERRGAGANDFFGSLGAGGWKHPIPPGERTGAHERMASDAEANRAAKLAGHRSFLRRLRGRLGRSNAEVK